MDVDNSEITRRGFMMVLSSPSGAGKTTLTRAILAEEPGLELSISVTTRKPRAGEIEGRHYHFIDRPRFDEMVRQGELLEHATVFGNAYGTPRRPIEQWLEAGRDVIGDLDWQGAQQLAERMSRDLVKVFILPPSVGELERRLTQRNQDDPAVLAARMAKARDEISHWAEYDYVFVNRDIPESVAKLRAIVTAERTRRSRQIGLAEFVRRVSGS